MVRHDCRHGVTAGPFRGLCVVAHEISAANGISNFPGSVDRWRRVGCVHLFFQPIMAYRFVNIESVVHIAYIAVEEWSWYPIECKESNLRIRGRLISGQECVCAIVRGNLAEKACL